MITPGLRGSFLICTFTHVQLADWLDFRASPGLCTRWRVWPVHSAGKCYLLRASRTGAAPRGFISSSSQVFRPESLLTNRKTSIVLFVSLQLIGNSSSIICRRWAFMLPFKLPSCTDRGACLPRVPRRLQVPVGSFISSQMSGPWRDSNFSPFLSFSLCF